MAPGERALAHGRAARLLDERRCTRRSRGHTAARHRPRQPSRGPSMRSAAPRRRRSSGAAPSRRRPTCAGRWRSRSVEDVRAEVVFELGQAEALVEGPAASARLTEALAPDPGARAARGDRGAAGAQVVLRGGRRRGAWRSAAEALAELGESEPGAARPAGGGAAAERDVAAGARRLAGELTARGLRARDAEGFGAKALLAEAAWVGALAGMPAAAVAARAEQALAGGELLAEDNGGPAFICAALVLAVADSELAPEICTAGLRAARATGNGFAFATNKTFTSRVRLFRGELSDAVADGTEGLEACEAYEIAIGPNYAGAFLAEALMERGDLDAAERVLERVNAPATTCRTPPTGTLSWKPLGAPAAAAASRAARLRRRSSAAAATGRSAAETPAGSRGARARRCA